MGSTASQLLRFLPGAAMTAGGAATGNPALATAGATSLAGAVPGLSGSGQSPDQQVASALSNNPSLSSISPGMVMGLGPGSPPLPATSGGFGNIGNTFASIAAPLLGVGGAMMANRPQPQQPTPMAPSRQGSPPLQANQQPVGPAQTVPPMAALAAYQKLLSGTGNS